MPQQWYILFFSRGGGFYDKFLPARSNYRHVALVCKRKLGWYLFNPHDNYIDFVELQIMASQSFDKHFFKMPDCIEWFKIEVIELPRRQPRITLPICTDVIKRIAGLQLAFTVSVKKFRNQLIELSGISNFTVLQHEVRDGGA